MYNWGSIFHEELGLVFDGLNGSDPIWKLYQKNRGLSLVFNNNFAVIYFMGGQYLHNLLINVFTLKPENCSSFDQNIKLLRAHCTPGIFPNVHFTTSGNSICIFGTTHAGCLRQTKKYRLHYKTTSFFIFVPAYNFLHNILITFGRQSDFSLYPQSPE